MYIYEFLFEILSDTVFNKKRIMVESSESLNDRIEDD